MILLKKTKKKLTNFLFDSIKSLDNQKKKKKNLNFN